MLRSYEYQALSSSINTLYSLNPVALKKGGFDALNSMQDENHSLDYLPGGPVSQAHEKGEQKSVGNDKGQGLSTNTRNGPSFIPLATPIDPNSMQCSITEVSSMSQTGLVPSRYQNSGSTQVGDGIPSHSELSSNIVMYPPSQVTFTQAARREGSAARPYMVSPGIPGEPNSAPGNLPPHTSTSSGVVPTGFSMNPSHNPRQHPQKQPTIDSAMKPRPGGTQAFPAQGHPQVIQGMQPEIAKGISPRLGDPQGFSAQSHPRTSQGLHPVFSNAMKPGHAAPPAFSRQGNSHVQGPSGQTATVNAVRLLPGGPQGSFKQPQEGSLISSQAAPTGPAVTSTQTVGVLHHQHQPPQQGLSQPNTKAERMSKPKVFAPVTRTAFDGLPANHQLRERLQNMANRQKGLIARNSEQNDGNVQDLEGTLNRNKPEKTVSLAITGPSFYKNKITCI